LTVRNYISSKAVNLTAGAGGATGSIDAMSSQFVIFKFAPYPDCKLMDSFCNKPRSKPIYKKILKKFECEKSLTFNPQYNAYGSFYRVSPQIVGIDNSIVFERH
jgi:hypothetical protein